MIPRIDQNLGIAGEPDEWVHSACLLCSNGCGLDIAVKHGRIVGVRGQPDHPVSFGHLGPKGEHAWVANNSKRRGTTPMIRRKRGAPLQPVNWAEAMDFFIEHFRDAWSRGHQNLACYNSGQLTIEELYTLGKFWRGGLQSANIDGNTRLCTATSATGLMANFGSDGPVASYADIDQAELLCLYAHNVAEVQTVLWERMLAAKRANGGRVIVADPRKTPTVLQGADLHLQLAPGTNVALMNGIIHLLIRNNWADPDFIEAHTVGFKDMEAVVRDYPPERVARLCEIPQADLETAAEWIGTTDRFVSTVLQGFYQSVEATAASSLVNSVHLLRGAIGKPGAGGSYPAYRNPHNEAQMRDLAALWNLDYVNFRHEVPNDIMTMMETAGRGDIEFMWVIGTNPLVSLPDQNRSRRILDQLVPRRAGSLHGRRDGGPRRHLFPRGDVGREDRLHHQCRSQRQLAAESGRSARRGAQSANQHTWYARDPVSHQPHLKSSPVAVRRLSFGEPEPWLIERLAELNGENIEPFAARIFA